MLKYIKILSLNSKYIKYYLKIDIYILRVIYLKIIVYYDDIK